MTITADLRFLRLKD